MIIILTLVATASSHLSITLTVPTGYIAPIIGFFIGTLCPSLSFLVKFLAILAATLPASSFPLISDCSKSSSSKTTHMNSNGVCNSNLCERVPSPIGVVSCSNNPMKGSSISSSKSCNFQYTHLYVFG